MIKKCLASDTAFIANRYKDGSTFHLQIIKGKKVRSLLYHHPETYLEDCKTIEEWKFISQISEWFAEEWFSERQFE